MRRGWMGGSGVAQLPQKQSLLNVTNWRVVSGSNNIIIKWTTYIHAWDYSLHVTVADLV